MLFTSRSVNLQGTKTGDAFANMSAAFDPPEKGKYTRKVRDLLEAQERLTIYLSILNFTHILLAVLDVPFRFEIINLRPEVEIKQ